MISKLRLLLIKTNVWNKSNDQHFLYTCASISEVPSYISTMVKPNNDLFFSYNNKKNVRKLKAQTIIYAKWVLYY